MAKEMPAKRRESLAEKGRTLYGKFCGTGGRGICAESFSVYHIGRGESVVAEDLIAYLEDVIQRLEAEDPESRLLATRGLVERIRGHLAVSEGLPITGPALREFVVDNTEGCPVIP